MPWSPASTSSARHCRATRAGVRGQGQPVAGRAQRLARLRVGADVASGGELHAAVRAGIPLDRIVFTGPGKTDARASAGAATRNPGHHGRVAGRAGDPHRPPRRRASGTGPPAPSRRRPRAEAAPIIGGRGAAKFGLSPPRWMRPSTCCTGPAPRSGPGRPSCAGPACVRGVERAGPGQIVDGVRRLAATAESVSRASWSADPAARRRWRPGDPLSR